MNNFDSSLGKPQTAGVGCNTCIKGFIDLVFYDERVDEWTIVDIKTSTKGWNKWAKADDKKKAQLLLYKEFFSKQFNIPLDKIKVEEEN